MSEGEGGTSMDTSSGTSTGEGDSHSGNDQLSMANNDTSGSGHQSSSSGTGTSTGEGASGNGQLSVVSNTNTTGSGPHYTTAPSSRITPLFIMNRGLHHHPYEDDDSEISTDDDEGDEMMEELSISQVLAATGALELEGVVSSSSTAASSMMMAMDPVDEFAMDVVRERMSGEVLDSSTPVSSGNHGGQENPPPGSSSSNNAANTSTARTTVMDESEFMLTPRNAVLGSSTSIAGPGGNDLPTLPVPSTSAAAAAANTSAVSSGSSTSASALSTLVLRKVTPSSRTSPTFPYDRDGWSATRKRAILAELESKGKESDDKELLRLIKDTRNVLKNGILLRAFLKEANQQAFTVFRTFAIALHHKDLKKGTTGGSTAAASTPSPSTSAASTPAPSTSTSTSTTPNRKLGSMWSETTHNFPGEVSPHVMERFGKIMNGWRTMFNSTPFYRDYAKEHLRGKVIAGEYFSDSTKTEDLQLFISHKPMQLIAHMLCSMLLEFISGDFPDSIEITMRLRKALESPNIYKKTELAPVYLFVKALIKEFLEVWFLERNPKPKEIFDTEFNLGQMNKMSLIEWYMERVLKPGKDCTQPKDLPPVEDVSDIEWLLECAGLLRSHRINGPCPDMVTKEEKEYVKKAYFLEPKNPFVILALLESVAPNYTTRRNSRNSNFDVVCRNLTHCFPRSAFIRLQLAKLFFVETNGRMRNQQAAAEYLRRALALNPSWPEVNFLCGKYLCGATGRTEAGLKFRDSFYRVALANDISCHKTTYEFFCSTLPSPRPQANSLFETNNIGNGISSGVETSAPSSNRPTTIHGQAAGGSSINEAFIEHYSLSVHFALSSSFAKVWPLLYRDRLQLLTVFCFYLYGDYGEALEYLLSIYKNNAVVSMIKNVDHYRAKYNWDAKLEVNAFVKWLQQEYDDILEMEAEERRVGESSIATSSSGDDDENLMNEDSRNRTLDDPIKEMLAYLLQVLQG